ncbi:unnamed protein product [Thelazia callipaeda]|uniref:Fanconi anemia group M protein n=1 Tax=Thelazia callipaeda TaxID=103827 RepID=A0A0N5CLU5_THECL|nr:unnamed protein product [Thelazia callipaeda]
MSCPEFSFYRRSGIQRLRLTNDGRSNMGLQKDQQREFEFAVTGHKKRECRKRKTCYQWMLACPSTSQDDSFEIDEINSEKLRSLSPILVDNTHTRSGLCSSTFLKDSKLKSVSLECSSLTNLELLGHRYSRNRTATSFSEISCSEKSHTSSNASPSFQFEDMASTAGSSNLKAHFATTTHNEFEKESKVIFASCDSICTNCDENDDVDSDWTTVPDSPPLEVVLSSASNHFSNTSSTLLETFPSFEDNDDDERLSDISIFSSRPLSEKSNSQVPSESDSDIFREHNDDVDDSETVCGNDSIGDLLIHEVEPDDANVGDEILAESIPSTTALQSRKNDSEEVPFHKPCHRLSKLAETLRKRMLLSSSDLAMWKCENPKEQPVKKVAVASTIIQWGIYWTLLKSVEDSGTTHTFDSQPMRKSSHARSIEHTDKQSGGNISQELFSEQEVFFLYQPLSKLNTPAGEFILAPRYYR